MTPRRQIQLCRLLLLGGSIFLVLGLVAVGTFLLTVGRFLAVADAPGRADAIVVLGGESSGFSRTQHALQLYNAGLAPLVIFSGGTMLATGQACSSAQLSQDAAAEMGLPAKAMRLAPEAQSTYDEAVNLSQMAQEEQWRSLIVVTDLFHSRRAVRSFRTLMPPGVQVQISPAANPSYEPQRWWRSERGLVAVFAEVLKLGYYWFTYGIGPV